MLPLRITIFSAFLKMEVQGHDLPQARCNSSTLLSMPAPILHFPSHAASVAVEGFGSSSHSNTRTYCRSASENFAQAPDGTPFAYGTRKPGGLSSSGPGPTLYCCCLRRRYSRNCSSRPRTIALVGSSSSDFSRFVMADASSGLRV